MLTHYKLHNLPSSSSIHCISGRMAHGENFWYILPLWYHWGLLPWKESCWVGPKHWINCTGSPPCFKCDASNIHDDRAMQLCFGPILVAHAEHGVSGVLLLCLASMGHHADFLKDFVVKAAAHPFSQIPILNDSMLLGELKDLLTLDPDGEIQATGIPPHVQQAVQLRHIMELCTESLTIHCQQTSHYKMLFGMQFARMMYTLALLHYAHWPIT